MNQLSHAEEPQDPEVGSDLTPYICPRRCAEAIDWYGHVFDAVEVGHRYVDTDGRVGHAELRIGDSRLMLSDAYPDYGVVAPPADADTATFTLHLEVPDSDATVDRAAAAGAVVQRAVGEEVVGSRMGTVLDPFGIRWMIASRVRAVSEQEQAARAAEFGRNGAAGG